MSIGEHTFNGCSNLKSVIFAEGNKLESIGDYSFGGCGSLTAITIPASVTSIGKGAFGPLTITFEGTKEQWNVILTESSWHPFDETILVCSDGVIQY